MHVTQTQQRLTPPAIMPLNWVPISVRASARLEDAVPEASASLASAAASCSSASAEAAAGSLGATSSASAASPGVMGRDWGCWGLGFGGLVWEGLGAGLGAWGCMAGLEGVIGAWPRLAVASAGAC